MGSDEFDLPNFSRRSSCSVSGSRQKIIKNEIKEVIRPPPIITIPSNNKFTDELLMPFEESKEILLDHESDDSHRLVPGTDKPFPVVDDIYDENILTDVDHVLSSLNTNELHNTLLRYL